MAWTGQPPADPGEFAEVYEQQIRHARSNDEEQPATPPEVAREYEKQLERGREEAFRKARDYFIRRAYELDVGTQSDLAEIFDLSQPTVSEIIQTAPAEDPRQIATADD